MKKSLRLDAIALSTFATLMPSLAFAHAGGDHVHGLLSGLEHPFLGFDHLLAMVAVGMIAARSGGLAALLVPASFVSAMVAGAVLGVSGIGLPAVETGIALSLVVFGAIVALWQWLPLSAAMALTALFGLFHGHAHGLEIPDTASGLAYAAGFALATATLHAVGAVSAVKLANWSSVLRAFGFGMSFVGTVMATQAI